MRPPGLSAASAKQQLSGRRRRRWTKQCRTSGVMPTTVTVAPGFVKSPLLASLPGRGSFIAMPTMLAGAASGASAASADGGGGRRRPGGCGGAWLGAGHLALLLFPHCQSVHCSARLLQGPRRPGFLQGVMVAAWSNAQSLGWGGGCCATRMELRWVHRGCRCTGAPRHRTGQFSSIFCRQAHSAPTKDPYGAAGTGELPGRRRGAAQPWTGPWGSAASLPALQQHAMTACSAAAPAPWPASGRQPAAAPSLPPPHPTRRCTSHLACHPFPLTLQATTTRALHHEQQAPRLAEGAQQGGLPQAQPEVRLQSGRGLPLRLLGRGHIPGTQAPSCPPSSLPRACPACAPLHPCAPNAPSLPCAFHPHACKRRHSMARKRAMSEAGRLRKARASQEAVPALQAY